MRSYLLIAIAVVAVASIPIWIFDPPLRIARSDQEVSYAAARFLSEPAMAGHSLFDRRCAICHGPAAQGQGDAPSLTGRAYTVDFRDAERFHGAISRNIEAHREILGGSGAALGFNDLELVAKFLRELRLKRPTDG